MLLWTFLGGLVFLVNANLLLVVIRSCFNASLSIGYSLGDAFLSCVMDFSFFKVLLWRRSCWAFWNRWASLVCFNSLLTAFSSFNHILSSLQADLLIFESLSETLLSSLGWLCICSCSFKVLLWRRSCWAFWNRWASLVCFNSLLTAFSSFNHILSSLQADLLIFESLSETLLSSLGWLCICSCSFKVLLWRRSCWAFWNR
jgi:hypothetical protein